MENTGNKTRSGTADIALSMSESKAKIMLDHFFDKTLHKIDREAKAMVVTSSRAHAVLYKQTIDRLLREDYAAQTQSLVAFSGKVSIKGHGTAYTEAGDEPEGRQGHSQSV